MRDRVTDTEVFDFHDCLTDKDQPKHVKEAAPTRTLSIYLFQKSVKAHREMLRNYDLYQTRSFPNEILPGTLFIRSEIKTSPLVEFLSGFDLSGLNLRTQVTGAAYLFEVENRWFAITFGQAGHHMLNDTYLVQDFGFKVALNSLDPEKIKCIDHCSFDVNQRNVRDQSALAAGVEHFGIETDLDLLKSLAGRAENSEFATQVGGRKGLRITSRLSPRNLAKKCAEALNLYNSDRHKERFEWAYNIQYENDRETKDLLNDYLCDYIRGTGTFENEPTLVLSPPEALDYELVQGYQIGSGKTAVCHPELHWDWVKNHIDTHSISIDRLKSIHVKIKDNDGVDLKKPSLWKCLVFEINLSKEGELQDDVHMLIGGQWYKVCRDYMTQINRAVQQIPEANVPLTAFDKKLHVDEKGYNRITANAAPSYMTNMDRKLIYRTGATGVEACDLFTRQNQFIHVKRFTGSKSFNHMVSQGLVSGKAFHADANFVEKLNDKLPARFKLNLSEPLPNAKNYEIVYAFFRNEPDLPFFSKIVLLSAYRHLTGLGYKVSLKRLDVREPLNRSTTTAKHSRPRGINPGTSYRRHARR
ncbi:DUF6119 family protein [Acanthopleuribacter pedis]|uniref:TIGR04141 family sporadically distributed protein n=1 Tax=Acanthopleuribacter pedis TaxID=442870 RepID=A0A8J7QLB5_9BACT|nr:DUF6119 family protein [Acanthopleuribacter pedis]MBO1323216.1 TIGR04141 family sporadically distributed protein [Acanthopleuribacter pedis]